MIVVGNCKNYGCFYTDQKLPSIPSEWQAEDLGVEWANEGTHTHTHSMLWSGTLNVVW